MGINGPTQPNRTGKSTPNDVVMTPQETADWIVNYYKPTGRVLEPCRGDGKFFNKPEFTDWCEISEGKNFFDFNDKVNWIITNPPFSIYDAFLTHALEIADNVVFFCPTNKALKSRKIDKIIQEYGDLKEIIAMGGGGMHGFPFGFPVGCLYYKRGYTGPITFTRAYPEKKDGTLEFPNILS